MDVDNVHHLLYLFKARENEIFRDLKKKMAAAVVFTKVYFWGAYILFVYLYYLLFKVPI
jgi:hypothetical protein